MNGVEQGCVVDASVGIRLFTNDSLSDAAYKLFAGLAAEPPIHIYVPDLFYIEVTNSLWKYIRWQGLAVEQAEEYLFQLRRLNLEITPTSNLMLDALVQAAMYNITAYDACYLALAQRMSVPLITADAKLARAIPKSQPVQLLK